MSRQTSTDEPRRGKPLTTNSLARLLKPYRIKPHEIRIGARNRNGYELKDFVDAFNRYLSPPAQTSTPLHPSSGAACSETQNSTPADSVEVCISREASKGATCRGVEVGIGKAGEGEGSVPYIEEF